MQRQTLATVDHLAVVPGQVAGHQRGTDAMAKAAFGERCSAAAPQTITQQGLAQHVAAIAHDAVEQHAVEADENAVADGASAVDDGTMRAGFRADDDAVLDV